MEQKSWIWTMNCLSQSSINSICCLNILPLLILKSGVPFKLIHTDQTGKLNTITRPSLTEVQEIFTLSLYPCKDPEIKCIQLSGPVLKSKLSNLQSSIQDPNILAIQGQKPKIDQYQHKIEYFQGFYSSTPFIFKVSAWVAINDVALEKFFLVYSLNCINLIEKSQQVNLNSFTVCFIKDNLGKFWIETFLPCSVFKLNIPRQSILNCKIIVSSSRLTKEKSLNRTQSYEKSKILTVKLKPRLEITSNKIKRFMATNSSISGFKKNEKVCFGTYCELKVIPEKILKHRKVEAWRFYTLPHDIIRKVIRKVRFPSKENDFVQEFYEKFKEEAVDRDTVRSRHDCDNIILCPVCYIVLQIASGEWTEN